MPTAVETREYQVRIIDNVLKAVDEGHRHILIEAPTGAGKTIVAHLIAQRLHEIYGYTAGWCAMRRHLIHQARAENIDKIGFEHIDYFSMFDKNPPKVDVLIDDECISGNSKLIVLHQDSPVVASMEDVCEGGVGSYVLSADDNGYIFQPITSRTCVGAKDVMLLSTGETSLLITSNGRIATSEGYQYVADINVATCCQIYSSKRRTTYGDSKTTTAVQRVPQTATSKKTQKCAVMRVRVWPKGEVELRRSLLQQVFVQPPYQAGPPYISNCGTEPNNQGVGFRGRKHSIYKKQKGRGNRRSAIQNAAFNKEAKTVHCLAVPTTRESDIFPAENQHKRGIRVGANSFFNLFNGTDIRNWQRIIPTSKDCNKRVPKSARSTRVGGMVDGRWLQVITRNSFIFNSRKRISSWMAAKSLGNNCQYKNGSSCTQAICSHSAARPIRTIQNSISARPFVPSLQVLPLPSVPIKREIINLGRATRLATYDIGVANTNCFFANGILIHNCHHTAAESAVTIYQKVAPQIHIGLTATPFRTDRMKLCFSRIIKDAGIRSLIDQGYLAPYHQYTFDFDWTPENVATVYLEGRERWGKTVGYFLTRDECDACAAIIRANGVPCKVVWANSDQEAQIAAFMRGDVPILLNMFILTEGFNAPDLQTVLVRPGSRGPTIQMVGRVLRPKPYAQVVQNSHTRWPFTRTASAERKFIMNAHGQWEERGVIGERLSAASRQALMAIPHISVDMPKYIDKHRKKPSVFGRD